MVIALLFVLVPSVAYGVKASRSFRFSSDNALTAISPILGLLVALGFFVTALIFESSKGFRRKVPLGFPGDKTSPRPVENSLSSLADLLGVGGIEVSWRTAASFLFASILSNAGTLYLSHWFEYADLSISSTILLVVNETVWCILLLFILRFTRNLFEAGLIVAVLWTLFVLFVYPEEFASRRSADNHDVRIALTFIVAWVAVPVFGVAAKHFRTRWLALCLGLMAEVVLLRLLTQPIWALAHYVSQFPRIGSPWEILSATALGKLIAFGSFHAALFATIFVFATWGMNRNLAAHRKAQI
jgi:hypothetical protein